MELRNVMPQDHHAIIYVLNEWWGGRNMVDMLPKLFFEHFQDTSFIIEDTGKIVGFLIGFLSQSQDKEAYIHFVGVHPDYRKHGIARKLYTSFMDIVKTKGCEKVCCITSPVNTASIAFHTKMGFLIEVGDKKVNNIWVHTNYDGKGNDRVLFMKTI